MTVRNCSFVICLFFLCRWYSLACGLASLGTAVFQECGILSRAPGICPYLQNFYVFAEICGIRYQYWAVIRGQIWHILVSFRRPYIITICRHDCAVKYTTATQALTGHWAELIWNIASLYGRQTISASCSCLWHILHIWLGSGAVED